MSPQEKDRLKFQIDQLRKSKILYAVESTAVSAAVILGVILTEYFATGEAKPILIAAGCLFGISYALWASLGNIRRHKEIKALEKRLYQ